jgi:hypothetical protein
LTLALARPQSRRIHAALEGAERPNATWIERFLKAMVNPELRAQIDRLPGNTSGERPWRSTDKTVNPAALGDDAPHLLVVDDDTRIRNLAQAVSDRKRLSRHCRRQCRRRHGASSPASTSTF